MEPQHSEGAGEMLQEDDGVMLLELFEQPPPLFDADAFAGGDVTQELLEAFQGGSLALVLVLLWRHLLAEGERCNTQSRQGTSGVTVPSCGIL